MNAMMGAAGAGVLANEAVWSWASIKEATIFVGARVTAFAALLTLSGDTRIEDKPQETRIALGVDEYLGDFSLKVNALPYSSWGANLPTTIEAYRAAIIQLGRMPNVTFHFNLSTPRGSLNQGIFLENAYKETFTSMEYNTVRILFPHKTTFYMKSGIII